MKGVYNFDDRFRYEINQHDLLSKHRIFRMSEECLQDSGGYEVVRDLLPPDINYKIVKCEMKDSSENTLKFELEIRAAVKTEAEVKVFLSSLNNTTGCTFNVQSGNADRRQSGGRTLSRLRGYRKCCFKVDKIGDRPDRQVGKNTECGASINFRLENPIGKDKTTMENRENYPLWINIKFEHNHALNRAEFFKFLSVTEETKKHYMEMFQAGISPSSAHIERKRYIKSQFPDSWPKLFANRSQVPSTFWVYKVHRQFMDQTVGSKDGVDAYQRAEELVKQYDITCKQSYPLPDNKYYAKIAQSEDGETAVVIVDNFMHRVHGTVPQAGDIIMVDATSNLDRNDSKLIHVVCPSPIGALPLADIIVTREDFKTLQFAFELLKSVLPDNAFYGRGVDAGPHVIMTDDCEAEISALAGAWPGSVLLLCHFHVLQAMWTWLWNSKNEIASTDRQHLITLFRAVLYAETRADLSERLEELYADEIVNKYPLFIKHLRRDTFPKIKSWSLQRRIVESLPTGHNNTNNLVESSFRYVKDIQFNRIRAFNLTDMLSLVMDRSDWYVNKVIDAANNRIESWLKVCHSKYVMKLPEIDPTQITQLDPSVLVYMVPSETDPDVSYLVDMDARLCSCPQGRLTGPCKHKELVARSKNIPSFDIIPSNSPKMRQLYMFLGTGQHEALDWFLPLQAEAEAECGDFLPCISSVPEVNQVNASVMVADSIAATTPSSEPTPEDVKAKLRDTLAALTEKILKRVDYDVVGYDKALSIFSKTVEKLPSTVDAALQKSLCSFGKSTTQVFIS